MASTHAIPHEISQHMLPVDHGEDCDPAEFAAQVLANARSSFAFGLRTLPKERREAMVAVYAFARIADDIADSQAARPDKLAALDAWSEEIERVFSGAPQSSVGHALAANVGRFELPAREFHLMLDGMRMDVNGPILAPSLDDLARYTRRVAGTIGQLSVRCFGSSASPDRDHFALALADALQLTNILRDVGEDAADGRIYLPREVLDEYKVPVDCESIATHENLASVCAAVGALAREQYAAARTALRQLKRAPLRPALIFMGVYEGYLDRIEALAWHSAKMHPMPRWEKIARGLRYAYLFPRRPADQVHGTHAFHFPQHSETLDAA